MGEVMLLTSHTIHRLAFTAAMVAAVLGTRNVAASDPRAPDRIPAEFETQAAMVIGWTVADPIIQNVQVEIVRNVSPQVPVVVLVDDDQERAAADLVLKASGIRARSIHLLEIPGDTIWIRDFGPMTVLRSDGRAELVDHHYADGKRPWDDMAAVRLARMLRIPNRRVPLTLEGGNIIANGRGIVLTTNRLYEQNAGRGHTSESIQQSLRTEFGVRQAVFLEPLKGEPTGHVDMFAAFVAPTTVVVGRYDPEVDPVNAAILDRNAERLRQIETADGCLEVVRIPMPAHSAAVWPTYANIVFAGRVVLVPVYSGWDAAGREEALAIFRRLLPKHRVVPIDCRELIRLGGALRCITLNVGRVGELRSELPLKR